MRALVRVQTGERRQQGGVDVEQPPFEMRDEGGREDAHEARQHHQRRLESPDRRRQCDIEAFARGKGLVIDHRRGQTPLAGEGQPAGIGPVADHGRHLGAQAV
jgi:hypothetical protein